MAGGNGVRICSSCNYLLGYHFVDCWWRSAYMENLKLEQRLEIICLAAKTEGWFVNRVALLILFEHGSENVFWSIGSPVLLGEMAMAILKCFAAFYLILLGLWFCDLSICERGLTIQNFRAAILQKLSNIPFRCFYFCLCHQQKIVDHFLRARYF